MKKIFLLMASFLVFSSYSTSAFSQIRVADCTGFEDGSDIVRIEAFYSLVTHTIRRLVVTDSNGETNTFRNPDYIEDRNNIRIILRSNDDVEVVAFGDGILPGEPFPSEMTYRGVFYDGFTCRVRFRGDPDEL